MDNFKELLTPEFIWCAVGVIMLIIEFAIPGFVIFFFGIGAFFVALLCFLTGSLSINAQLIIFLISSIVLLLVLRRWFKAIFKGFFGSKNKMPLNKKYNVGETATVVEKITPYEKGKIEFHGSRWLADSNIEIAKGTTVVIVEQNNLTFKVKPIVKKIKKQTTKKETNHADWHRNDRTNCYRCFYYSGNSQKCKNCTAKNSFYC